MKNSFAKRLIPVLLCISLVLSIMGKMSAFASYRYVPEEQESQYPIQVSLSDFVSQYGASDNYIYLSAVQTVYNSQYSRNVNRSYSIYLPISADTTYTENTNDYTLEYKNYSGKYGVYEYFIHENGRMISNYEDEGSITNFYARDIVISKNLSSITFDTNIFEDSDIISLEIKVGDLEKKYSSIKVLFTPDLTGQVDRSFEDHGKTGYFENFDFEIWNNGNEAIQYKMYIVEKNQTNTRPVITNQNETYKQYDTLRYDDDEVFIYYTKDWVYSTETEVEKHASDKNGSWLNPNIFHKTSTEPKLRYKGTDWHYLEAGGYKHQPIYYSQVNLKEGTEYTVYVLAQTCPYTSASTIWSDEGNIDNKSMSAAEYDIVYQSDFTMLQYSDVKYDPEDSRNGVLPYDGYQGLLDQTVYDVSYDAEQDSNGNINYSGFNFDKSQIPDTYGNTPSNLDGGAEIISNTSGVFKFFSVIFGVFPPEVNKILSISLWVGFALFLIRRLT